MIKLIIVKAPPWIGRQMRGKPMPNACFWEGDSDPGWTVDGPRMDPGWTPDGPYMDAGWTVDGW